MQDESLKLAIAEIEDLGHLADLVVHQTDVLDEGQRV
jgi:hypothetical protein